MSTTEDYLLEDALAEARREGAQLERRRGRRRLAALFVGSVLLLVVTLVAGWALVAEAREAAPEVIAEIAAERREAMEARLAERTEEAGALAGDLFAFLQQTWAENESLHRIRSSVEAARAELSSLDDEVRAALDAPTVHLGPLLDTAPERARQLVEHLVTIAAEMQRLVPAVMDALGDAHQAFEASPAGETIRAVVASMDALLDPFLGDNVGLQARWASLKGELFAWLSRVEADLELAREQMSGDELGDAFLARLAERVF